MKRAVNIMNRLAQKGTPFLFVIDFAMKHPLVLPLDRINPEQILYDVNGLTNVTEDAPVNKQLDFRVTPVDKDRYCKAFDLVRRHILRGDTFLLNLTMPSPVQTNYSLKEIFLRSNAPYKLWMKGKTVVFSPETFVKIKDNVISSYPMKGTMDAGLPDAENRLLQSRKELGEHYTITDLIRNDLSMVARNVSVVRFRYIDRIKVHNRELLQMSSEISGRLRPRYVGRPGSVLQNILPAGSVSGAPKKKTLEIISKAEQYDRGWYTGVFGIYDGNGLDSAVMIRYIEQQGKQLIYKSGGGITALSDCEEEYNELIQKVYVPFA